MDPKDNIAGHISKLENLSKQVKKLGEPISESILITKTFMTLPDIAIGTSTVLGNQ